MPFCCIGRFRKLHIFVQGGLETGLLLYRWSRKWHLFVHGGGFRKRDFVVKGGSRNQHFIVQGSLENGILLYMGVSKIPFFVQGGLDFPFLLYMVVSKMPFFCIGGVSKFSIFSSPCPSPFLDARLKLNFGRIDPQYFRT